MPRFTEQYIKQLKPRPDRYDVTETGVAAHQRGLQCRVFPSGAKSWLFRYTVKGKTERVTLGTYPTMTLRGAHAARKACREQLEAKTTPKEARIQEQAQREQQHRERARKTSRTVAALADHFINGECRQMAFDPASKTWLESKKPGRIRKSWPEVQRIIEKDIIPPIGDRPVTDIEPHEIAALLRKIRDRGAPIGANRTFSILKQMFSHAVALGWLRAAENPCRDLARPMKVEPHRERALKDDEIRAFWRALDVAAMLPMMRYVYRLILTTGCRPGEATRAEWSEFDLEADDPSWTIPATRSKNEREHTIPLAPLAVQVLEELRAVHEAKLENDRKDNPDAALARWLFPAFRKAKDVPVEEKAAAHAIRRNREFFELDAFTPHDLRRTVRTGLAALGVDSITAKKVVNHKLEGMDKVYDQHPYTEEKRAALEKWCRHLEETIKGNRPKVTNIKARQRKVA